MDLDDIKRAQLKEAMKLDEMGVDPDKIMVTYSPEEYASMNPEGFESYEHSEHDNFLLENSVIGDYKTAATIELSKYAFSRGFQTPDIDTYLDQIEKELPLLENHKYEDLLLDAQRRILEEFSIVIKQILEGLKDELAEFDELTSKASGYHAKIELEEDRRTTSRITSRVDSTYRKIIELQNQIAQRLDPGMGTR